MDPSHLRLTSRRGFLHAGFLGGVGLSMGKFMQLEAMAAAQPGRTIKPAAHSVINIFLGGGMAAQESFDPKPHAPE